MLKIIQIPLILLIIWLGGRYLVLGMQVRGFCGDEAPTELVVKEDSTTYLPKLGMVSVFPPKERKGLYPQI